MTWCWNAKADNLKLEGLASPYILLKKVLYLENHSRLTRQAGGPEILWKVLGPLIRLNTGPLRLK